MMNQQQVPAALVTSMGKEKKPFTYLPGGLDFSEIRSPRMAKRLARHQATIVRPDGPPKRNTMVTIPQQVSTPTAQVSVPQPPKNDGRADNDQPVKPTFQKQRSISEMLSFTEPEDVPNVPSSPPPKAEHSFYNPYANDRNIHVPPVPPPLPPMTSQCQAGVPPPPPPPPLEAPRNDMPFSIGSKPKAALVSNALESLQKEKTEKLQQEQQHSVTSNQQSFAQDVNRAEEYNNHCNGNHYHHSSPELQNSNDFHGNEQERLWKEQQEFIELMRQESEQMSRQNSNQKHFQESNENILEDALQQQKEYEADIKRMQEDIYRMTDDYIEHPYQHSNNEEQGQPGLTQEEQDKERQINEQKQREMEQQILKEQELQRLQEQQKQKEIEEQQRQLEEEERQRVFQIQKEQRQREMEERQKLLQEQERQRIIQIQQRELEEQKRKFEEQERRRIQLEKEQLQEQERQRILLEQQEIEEQRMLEEQERLKEEEQRRRYEDAEREKILKQQTEQAEKYHKQREAQQQKELKQARPEKPILSIQINGSPPNQSTKHVHFDETYNAKTPSTNSDTQSPFILESMDHNEIMPDEQLINTTAKHINATDIYAGTLRAKQNRQAIDEAMQKQRANLSPQPNGSFNKPKLTWKNSSSQLSPPIAHADTPKLAEEANLGKQQTESLKGNGNTIEVPVQLINSPPTPSYDQESVSKNYQSYYSPQAEQQKVEERPFSLNGHKNAATIPTQRPPPSKAPQQSWKKPAEYAWHPSKKQESSSTKKHIPIRKMYDNEEGFSSTKQTDIRQTAQTPPPVRQVPIITSRRTAATPPPRLQDTIFKPPTLSDFFDDGMNLSQNTPDAASPQNTLFGSSGSWNKANTSMYQPKQPNERIIPIHIEKPTAHNEIYTGTLKPSNNLAQAPQKQGADINRYSKPACFSQISGGRSKPYEPPSMRLLNMLNNETPVTDQPVETFQVQAKEYGGNNGQTLPSKPRRAVPLKSNFYQTLPFPVKPSDFSDL